MKLLRLKRIFINALLAISLFKPDIGFAAVDHKTPGLDLYLNQIGDNQDEKTGIINKIIQKTKSGSFIDIGSGRESVSYLLSHLPSDQLTNVNLIAADLEGETLKDIAQRHIDTLLDLDNNSNIKLSLVKMDATEMHKIGDNSIKAINASALLHEVNSYVATKTPIDRFFSESIRILEKNGMLVYRDPTLQDRPDELNSLIMKEDLAKYFVYLFLPKFLDNKLTKMVDMHGNSIKPNFDYQNNLKITCYQYDKQKPLILNYQQFFDLQSEKIDFSKGFIIKAPRRLLSEIERHYVLFIKDVYPTGFLDIQSINTNNSLASIVSDKASTTISAFANYLGVNYKKNLTIEDIEKLTSECNKIKQIVKNGISINKSEIENFQSIESLLRDKKISPALYKIDHSSIWLDAKLFTILAGRISYRSEDTPSSTISWLIREGEEYYFYYTTAELVDYLQRFCAFYLKDTDKEGYILAPASNADIRYADRKLYREVLSRDMEQIDINNNRQEFITSKTIILFKLMTYSEFAEQYSQNKIATNQ